MVGPAGGDGPGGGGGKGLSVGLGEGDGDVVGDGDGDGLSVALGEGLGLPVGLGDELGSVVGTEVGDGLELGPPPFPVGIVTPPEGDDDGLGLPLGPRTGLGLGMTGAHASVSHVWLNVIQESLRSAAVSGTGSPAVPSGAMESFSPACTYLTPLDVCTATTPESTFTTV